MKIFFVEHNTYDGRSVYDVFDFIEHFTNAYDGAYGQSMVDAYSGITKIHLIKMFRHIANTPLKETKYFFDGAFSIRASKEEIEKLRPVYIAMKIAHDIKVNGEK